MRPSPPGGTAERTGSEASTPDRERFFRAGLQAFEEQRFQAAADWLHRAIASDPVETASARIAISPETAVPYLPHHYLALALASLGDCDAAVAEWRISLEQRAFQQTDEFRRLDSVRNLCEGRLLRALATAAMRREAPGRAMPQAPPNPDLERADAEINAAAAAIARIEESAGAGSSAQFHRDLARARSLLDEAKRTLSAARTGEDRAASARAAELAATARGQLDTLLRQAGSRRAGAVAAPRGHRTAAQPPPAGAAMEAEPPPVGAGAGGGQVSPLPPIAASPSTRPAPQSAQRGPIPFEWLLLGAGLLLLGAMLVLAVVVPQPTSFQYLVFRTTLSLAATCVAASIPWLTGVAGDYQRAGSAGGAIAVFLLVYLVDPFKRLARPEGKPAVAAAPGIPESCIFICYRRADSEDVVGRLHAALVKQFGDAAVFKDVDDIPLGADFRKVLRGAVASCRVILAVIGPAWDEVKNEAGQRKIDDASDYLRLEISSALQRDIPVIPVLVRRPTLPAADHLPTEVRDLVYRQAIQLRPDPDFDHDVERLVTSLVQILNRRQPAAT